MDRVAIYEEIKQVVERFNALEPFITIDTVDWWNENVDFLEEETPFELPALFVEFGEIQYQPVKGDHARGQCDMALHVVVDCSEASVQDCVSLCDRLIKSLYSRRWFMCRSRSLTNHNHAEIIECIEWVRVTVE